MAFEQAYLNYAVKQGYDDIAHIQWIEADCSDERMANSVRELQAAIGKMTGTEPMVKTASGEVVTEGASAVSARDGQMGACEVVTTIKLFLCEGFEKEAYRISEAAGAISVEASDSAGILYGTFELIRQMQLEQSLKGIAIQKKPEMPLRMLNHWDNMDGSIERGYSGNSFFFVDNEVVVDERTVTYARLLAAVGINGTVINNVNVKDCATYLITDRYWDKLRELSEILDGYGVKLYLSLNYAAPVEMGETETADPLSEEVKSWWKKRMQMVYAAVPKLGGFLIKADSEGRPGPFTYNRTHADGANMLAEAVEPYGGLIIWRCFVYNCQQDWRDRKTDRARSGYDNFIGLDGSFKDNVILQIKNGPMDFQVREPVHPLFGGLTKTNQILEVQIAQEYTGQQRHICYLIPMFKEILAFRTYVRSENDTVRDIVSGKTFSQINCGMAAVANTGNDENWTGHDLAMANLYGFGRLAFEPGLTAEQIAAEWIAISYGKDELVREVLLYLLMESWPTYEKYNAPLGIGWMVNPSYHYGPNVDGYEYDRWGTYHRADHLGIGVDRTENGTGYALLYHEPHAGVYNDVKQCPDELLLFFHHVPYTWKLKSGKTVIQHIYDTHFEGVETVDEMVKRFESLQGRLPGKVYVRIKERMEHQKQHSREWRDQINTYFYRKSGIADEKGREIY
ncbi:MAG: alpha-glucuronidase [Lachnospiraceae bacterium]|nr:alpha-glucuronidase [Lachnospiraceae bacterium]